MKIGMGVRKEDCKKSIFDCDAQLVEQVVALKSHLKDRFDVETEDDFFPKLLMAVYALGIARGLNQAILANSNSYDSKQMNLDMTLLSKELNLSKSVVRELKEL